MLESWNAEKINRLTMDFVMLPSKTLCDSDAPPFWLTQQPKDTRIVRVEVFLREHLEKLLWNYDMAILVMVIGIAVRIVNPGRGMKDDQLGEGKIDGVTSTFLCIPPTCAPFPSDELLAGLELPLCSSDTSPVGDLDGER
jgi:hypothetical protein